MDTPRAWRRQGNPALVSAAPSKQRRGCVQIMQFDCQWLSVAVSGCQWLSVVVNTAANYSHNQRMHHVNGDLLNSA